MVVYDVTLCDLDFLCVCVLRCGVQWRLPGVSREGSLHYGESLLIAAWGLDCVIAGLKVLFRVSCNYRCHLELGFFFELCACSSSFVPSAG